MSTFTPFSEPLCLAIGASTLGLVALLVSAALAWVGFQRLRPWLSDGRLDLICYLAVGALLALSA